VSSDNPFYRLAPFIQEFIYSHNWTELRAVQVEACRVIFDSDAHLLLATGTASGKTEAAFLPVLTLMHEEPPASVEVLYIGPTKALINDQFLRLNDLLHEADIPCWHWHGDVSQGEKAGLLKAPRGVLQITPESLESLLINKTTELSRLFGGLRFVIIDEVHVFMGSDRGRQILCQLARLAKYVRREPRRIGLSATLGDYALAEAWLAAGSEHAVITPRLQAGPHRVRLAVEHFYLPAEKDQDAEENGDQEPLPGDMEDQLAAADADAYNQYLFDASLGRKTLIFANSRGETESIIAGLRQIAQRQRAPDIYHVHHGSIAAPLREAAERAMREPDVPAVTAATVTLELGIDIGQLERVIQVQAPFSVASFLQRLGRSGRRGTPSEMWFVCAEEVPGPDDALPERIPWQLLQCIAIIQLYLEEHWIEPVKPAHYPVSLLYHQTMSTLTSQGELTPAALAQRVLTLPPLRSISQDDYRSLLRHLIGLDHIQQTDERGLIVGLAGERVVGDFRFYAVFPDNEEYAVREESREIGSIVMPPPPGERFALAGRAWEVIEIDAKRKLVRVKPIGGKAKASWTGHGGDIHSRVLQRMRQALLSEDTIYPFLQTRAQERLTTARSLAKNSGLVEQNIVPLGGDTFCVFPWMGTAACRTLMRALRTRAADPETAPSFGGLPPYYFTFSSTKGGDPVRQQIDELCQAEVTPDDLVDANEGPELNKYDRYLPSDLLRKAFAADWLDIDEMKKRLSEWK
jgi:ATP-dependent helicase Lhr and Lhr-like helicase